MSRMALMGAWATCALMLTHPVVAATLTHTINQTDASSASLPGASVSSSVVPSTSSRVAAGAAGAIGDSTPRSTPWRGIVRPLPGVIAATDYDEGGSGLAYLDTSIGNAGGHLRADHVDIEPSSEGGYNIGWVAPGEWLRYSTVVAAAGTYELQVRVASPGQGGTFHIEAHGIDITGPMTIPDTGGWQRWSTIVRTVTVAAGPQVWTLKFDSAGPTGGVGNVSRLSLMATSPYQRVRAVIPGTIGAERFDEGGEGVAYHDTTAGNAGSKARTTDVDIESRSSGGYNVAYTSDGEWLAYSVNVLTAGAYTLAVDIATPLTGPAIHIEIGGATIPIPVTATSGWQAWRTVSVPVTLKAGPQTLRLVFDIGGINVGKMTFIDPNSANLVTPAPPPATKPVIPAGSGPALLQVAATDDLQAWIDAARPGDTLLLAAGATYVGNFVLPAKTGDGYVTIRSATPDALLPPQMTRITPAAAPLLARLRSPNSMPAMRTAPGAHHYRLLFLEFAHNANGAGNVIDFGDGSSAQNTLAMVPHNLIIDRCYVHGDAAVGQKRGLGLNSGSAMVINSHFADFKAAGIDSQAIAGWNGPGPYAIVNNYLEAAGENVMFGGADPSIPDLVPSDITVLRNHFSRPMSWKGGNWTIKNLFELKNAQRVLIEGNLFENHWAQAQAGYAIVFTPRNQDGRAPWTVVQQVRFANNVIRNVSAGINILGQDNVKPSQLTNNIVITNNLFENVSAKAFGGPGRFMLINGGADITVDHNTVLQDGTTALYSDAKLVTGFVFTNNIVPDNSWAVMGVNTSPGNGTIKAYFPNGQFLGGVFAGSKPANYPAGNYYPPNMAGVGFVDLAQRNYRLDATSSYRLSATDGTDIGCHIDQLNVAAGTSY